MTYRYYPVREERLAAELVRSEYARLLGRVEAAEAAATSAPWLDLFGEWNALQAYVTGEGSRLGYAFNKDVSNAKAEDADCYFREEVTPASEEGSLGMARAVLASRHRHAIAERWGRHLLTVLAVTLEPLAPVNSPLRVAESDVVHGYEKQVAAGEVVVAGRPMTLAAARNLEGDHDESVRREAFTAYRGWFLAHRPDLAETFAELVRLRDRMARNLGHPSYVRLGYLAMGRTDYGAAEVAELRAAIRRHVVPLGQRIQAAQARRLGSPRLRPWDLAFDPATSLPTGIAPVASQLNRAQRVFDRIHPRLAGHFRRMRDEQLIDLENRKAKQAGAYCTSFPDEPRIAIFCNSTGDEKDVSTLMHEMGHAFQGWESLAIAAVDLQNPTSEVCEVHSMGMEYLSLRHMDEFFTAADAARFRRNRWREAVALIAYIAVVDEFQHWVYENPAVSTAERDQAWDRIWDLYKPDIDWSGVEGLKCARWYAQGHVFHAPFYYIDYAMAELGAMQLAALDARDPGRALEVYLELCGLGGTRSALELFAAAGLRSPFDPDLLPELMAYAAEEVGV